MMYEWYNKIDYEVYGDKTFHERQNNKQKRDERANLIRLGQVHVSCV